MSIQGRSPATKVLSQAQMRVLVSYTAVVARIRKFEPLQFCTNCKRVGSQCIVAST